MFLRICGFIFLLGCSGTSKTYFMPHNSPALKYGNIISSYDSGYEVELPAEHESIVQFLEPNSFDLATPQQSAYDFSSMEKKLEEFAENFPNLVSLETYGTSRQGRPEYVLTLTNKFNSEDKPEYLITGATHGNETITVDTVLGLIETLLEGFDTNPRFAQFINFKKVYFIPAVCVDSYVARTREAEGRDPNRDYPYPDVPQRNPVGCIKDVISFFDSKNIVGTMDYHSAASMYMFPWAYTYQNIPQPDYDKLYSLTKSMAETNGFQYGPIASTIYVAKGSSADYYYWKRRSNAIAVEVSRNNASPGTIVQENAEATWKFLEE